MIKLVLNVCKKRFARILDPKIDIGFPRKGKLVLMIDKFSIIHLHEEILKRLEEEENSKKNVPEKVPEPKPP